MNTSSRRAARIVQVSLIAAGAGFAWLVLGPTGSALAADHESSATILGTVSSTVDVIAVETQPLADVVVAVPTVDTIEPVVTLVDEVIAGLPVAETVAPIVAIVDEAVAITEPALSAVPQTLAPIVSAIPQALSPAEPAIAETPAPAERTPVSSGSAILPGASVPASDPLPMEASMHISDADQVTATIAQVIPPEGTPAVPAPRALIGASAVSGANSAASTIAIVTDDVLYADARHATSPPADDALPASLPADTGSSPD